MSKKRSAGGSRPPTDRQRSGTADPKPSLKDDPRARIGFLIVTLLLIAVVVIGADFVLGAVSGGGAAPSATPSAGPTPFGVIVPGDNGGHWTNVSPGQLAQMLENKDFTLLNVKTPYSNEIDRTDLYIPYDQLTARASELPPDKATKILVYCLTGHSSAIATQTLLDLGYTNVWNLDGGMNAWVASGRALVDKNR
jgi:rhodanese-related sulfurtransferase